MSRPTELAAQLLGHVAAQNGVNVDSSTAIALAQQVAEFAVNLLDEHAKARAAADGKAASDAVTSEGDAEAEQRKP